MNLLRYSLSKTGLQLKQCDQAGKLLITKIIWFLTLLGDFWKLFYLPCMSGIGKRSLAKAGFTARTNNSSLFCHIYELKLQRKQQITYNTNNCVQIGHSATCKVGDIISLTSWFVLTSCALHAWHCHTALSKSSQTASVTTYVLLSTCHSCS